mmetsp:Transcript_56854/g.165059  ORF Transcript_56854/g.165059 Transcript_56854/m.165059 type:complete len:291 (-) Transcript_56854:692-1564(-)
MLTVPLPSRSKALKAYHKFNCDLHNFGSSAPATNSCKFTVPEPSRSSKPTTSSRSSIRASWPMSSLRMHWQISGTPKTPSPLRSKNRNARSIISTSRVSAGNCCAITRITIRLKCPSLAFSRMLRNNRSNRVFDKRARGIRNHGWRSNALAPGLNPPFIFNMLSTQSRASFDNSDHSSPNSTPCVFKRSTRSSRDGAQCGGTPVNIWYTMQPRLQTSNVANFGAKSSKSLTTTSSQASSGAMHSTSSCRGCCALSGLRLSCSKQLSRRMKPWPMSQILTCAGGASSSSSS